MVFSGVGIIGGLVGIGIQDGGVIKADTKLELGSERNLIAVQTSATIPNNLSQKSQKTSSVLENRSSLESQPKFIAHTPKHRVALGEEVRNQETRGQHPQVETNKNWYTYSRWRTIPSYNNLYRC